MKKIGVIPARMAASRFPGKPLHLILGKPMLKEQDVPVWIAPEWEDKQRTYKPVREV